MVNPQQKETLDYFGRALDRLEEALQLSRKDNPVVVDATIQRFEFCVEFLWKSIKRFLEAEGQSPKSPRETLQQAYALGWIQDEQVWLDMLKDRNLTSHTYDEEQAERIYSHVKIYYPKMREVYLLLRTK